MSFSRSTLGNVVWRAWYFRMFGIFQEEGKLRKNVACPLLRALLYCLVRSSKETLHPHLRTVISRTVQLLSSENADVRESLCDSIDIFGHENCRLIDHAHTAVCGYAVCNWVARGHCDGSVEARKSLTAVTAFGNSREP